jgi:hypothetical protein
MGRVHAAAQDQADARTPSSANRFGALTPAATADARVTPSVVDGDLPAELEAVEVGVGNV